MNPESHTRRTTKIEWSETVWNPVVGCEKITSGCKNCYAESMHRRHLGNPKQPKYIKPFSEVVTWPDELLTPFQWKDKRKVFVCSMSDLFNKDVPIDFIQEVFKVMNNTPHQYQILTKRSRRMMELAPSLNWTPNIWAGVSVEDHKNAIRINHLRLIPASVRFISFEPLIGDVGAVNLKNIHWAIIGGESGHAKKSLRPMKKDWVTSLRDQCAEQGVAMFFKQWGHADFNPDSDDPTIPSKGHTKDDGGKYSKGGYHIDGIVYREYPDAPNHYPDQELRDELYALEEKISQSVKGFTDSWITIGESLSIIKDRIEKLGSGKLYWQTYLGVDSFQDYCRTRLQLSRETATQMRQAFLLMQTLKPELLDEGREIVPSWTKLRTLSPYQEKLVQNPEKYAEVVEHAFDETPRSDFEREVRQKFQKKRPKSRAKKQAIPEYEDALNAGDWDRYLGLVKRDLYPNIIPPNDEVLDTIIEQLRSLLLAKES
ncbi:MAG: phage Gp37/Gp68 family protein [Candidatus Marinimicrobia bacterium]|jgi:protein gp37|nr:phage Gp37/Gp68 family protein [Candidatus Neomarinimicrobiota bacterium]MBT3950704.1 phage Gp37/Gp68 family protein [Candidatus Neomarinimicrobiota bacterium]MBT4253312.1 phage Gp37/Gp68 family protein [Candidatus Neomarinimicrobiota bacterium]MBT5235542.1 phage Gp37/Gp68 family protein [Candidatus Neomarinimicrobiota bacterium]MBT5787350.1 phage Gp37/Gp68 family protein [Candidatus Neomarinimicrobiota bacterium]